MGEQTSEKISVRETERNPSPASRPAVASDVVVVVVATYNERINIGRMIPEIMALPVHPRMVIVDDNSPDGTGAVIEELLPRFPGRIELIKRPGKLGYGSAFVAGFERALEMGASRIVSMDADFSHDPQSIPAMTARLDEEDLVIGSRYVGGLRILNWSWRRLMLSTFANFYVKTILGFRFFDCTSGFRAYRRETIRAIDFGALHSQGYSFLVEILEHIHRRKLRVAEHPIIYYERREGQSKMSRKVIFEAMLRPYALRWGRLFSR